MSVLTINGSKIIFQTKWASAIKNVASIKNKKVVIGLYLPLHCSISKSIEQAIKPYRIFEWPIESMGRVWNPKHHHLM